MKVVFVGAGNVATHLATELHRHLFSVVQIYSRTIESAKTLADTLEASYTSDMKQIRTDADLYIFAVKDSVLIDIISNMPHNNGLWIHTAGSMPLNVFASHVESYGVIYPFQTFTKGRSIHWENTPIFIESSDSKTLDSLRSIASKISDKIFVLSSDKREYVHLTGVFACNFSNHMYTIAQQLLKEADLPFDVAVPLIDETCAKIHLISPTHAQTGPAVRFDTNVMERHIELIKDKKQKEIYRLISENIFSESRKIQQNKKRK